jgi:hypothetical protein
MTDPHEWRDPPTFFSATNANPTPPVPRFPVAGIALIGGVCVWAVILWWALS